MMSRSSARNSYVAKRPTNLDVESGKPVIDGRALKVSLTKKDVQAFGAVRLWDKTQRSALTPEARLAFFKAATSHILPKGNKLSAPCVATADNDELLAQVENLQCQIV